MSCICTGVPPGLGEPCFDKLEAKLAHAMLSLPATKGFEIGSGFEGTVERGSTHNDMFTKGTMHGDTQLLGTVSIVLSIVLSTVSVRMQLPTD